MENIKKVNVSIKLTLGYKTNDEFEYIRERVYAFVINRQKEHKKEKHLRISGHPIYEEVLRNINKHFHSNDDYEVALSNFEEHPGSFIATFSLIIIGTITNYSVFSENLEKFVNDLKYLFNEEFETRIDYTKEYHKVSKANTEITASPSIPTQVVSKSKVWLPLLAAIGLSFAGIFDDQLFSDRTIPLNNNTPITEQYIEYQISEEKEKGLYKVYDQLIIDEIKKSQVDQDTLKEEFLEGLRRQLDIYKASAGVK